MMRVHEAGRLQTEDCICILTSPDFIRVLDRLFGGPAVLKTADIDICDALTILPEAHLSDLAQVYGIDIGSESQPCTVSEYMSEQLGRWVERGDRLAIGNIDLVVGAIGPGGTVGDVGL